MSAIDNIMNMTKYMVTLPVTHISVLIIVFLSFFTGIIAFLIEPGSNQSILSSIIYGGSTGFLIFGLMSIMAGAITTPLVNMLEGRHMKMKQSMFLALISMVRQSGITFQHLQLHHRRSDLWMRHNIRLQNHHYLGYIKHTPPTIGGYRHHPARPHIEHGYGNRIFNQYNYQLR
jgi:predicted neutral ceramidase superfamily lipid hydrolase